MKRIYVSTVGRGKEKQESSKVYCIDCETGKLCAEVKLPLSMLDLGNPRGGCRGARGLAFGYSLYAAGFDGVFRLNPDDLFIEHGRWFREIRDIHQIYFRRGLLELASTFDNRVYCMNVEKDVILSEVQDYSDVHEGLPPPDWFPGCRDTLHLNSFTDRYGLCAKAAVIFDRQTRKVCMESQEFLRGSHDIWELSTGELAVNNSKESRTIAIDPNTWTVSRMLYEETKTEGGSELAKRGWTRGMSYLPQRDLLMVGSSPAEVIIIEDVSNSPRITGRIPISDDIVEATFDVIPHPEDWK